MLAEIHASFTEGFADRDLKEAKEVLEALDDSDAKAERADEGAILAKEGELWRVSYLGQTFRMSDTKGLACLDHLLRHPDREFHAIELASAIDGGAVSNAEKARVNLTRAIRSAIARIGEHSPVLEAHLEASVQTGTFFLYRPTRP